MSFSIVHNKNLGRAEAFWGILTNLLKQKQKLNTSELKNLDKNLWQLW